MQVRKNESKISFYNESDEIKLDQVKMKTDERGTKEEKKIELECSLED